MIKRVMGRKFSRARKSRTALFRSLISELVLRGSIKTTKPKALVLAQYFKKYLRLAGRPTLGNRRILIAKLGNNSEVANKIFDYAANWNKKSLSVSTQALGQRRGDNALMYVVKILITLPEQVKEVKEDEKVIKKVVKAKVTNPPTRKATEGQGKTAKKVKNK